MITHPAADFNMKMHATPYAPPNICLIPHMITHPAADFNMKMRAARAMARVENAVTRRK